MYILKEKIEKGDDRVHDIKSSNKLSKMEITAFHKLRKVLRYDKSNRYKNEIVDIELMCVKTDHLKVYETSNVEEKILILIVRNLITWIKLNKVELRNLKKRKCLNYSENSFLVNTRNY